MKHISYQNVLVMVAPSLPDDGQRPTAGHRLHPSAVGDADVCLYIGLYGLHLPGVGDESLACVVRDGTVVRCLGLARVLPNVVPKNRLARVLPDVVPKNNIVTGGVIASMGT